MPDTWTEIGNKCLTRANALLDRGDVPTMETIKAVSELVKIAIAIDYLNLRWAQQSRSGAAVFPAKLSSQPATRFSQS